MHLELVPQATRLPRSLADLARFAWVRVLFPNSPASPEPIRLSALLVLLFLPGVLLYPSLNFRLFEPDEGRYAEIPREMLARGEWVVPYLQREPYLDKPPLLYWCVMVSYRLLGVHDWAARLAPALAVHITILLTYLIGRRRVGERAAFWGALLLSLAPGFVSIGRLLVLDGLLALWTTLAVFALFEAVQGDRLKWSWWLTAAISCGLGVLTKGPVILVLAVPPLVAHAWLTGRRLPVGRWAVAAFVGVVALVTLPWYVAVTWQLPDFPYYFFWQHNVVRFLTPFDHQRPVWFYGPVLVLGLLPGSLLLPAFVRSLFGATTPGMFRSRGTAVQHGHQPEASAREAEVLWRMRGLPHWRVGLVAPSSPATFGTAVPTTEARTPALGFLLLAAGWCVLFFSLSGCKLPTYILPAYPPLALALGAFVTARGWHRTRWATGAVVASVVFLLLAHHLALPWFARFHSPMSRADVVARYCSPTTPVVCYPRSCDSVGFYLGRDDLNDFRGKDTPELIEFCKKRPKVVILFMHRHSLQAFRQVLPAGLTLTEETPLFDSARANLQGVSHLLRASVWDGSRDGAASQCFMAVVRRDGGR